MHSDIVYEFRTTVVAEYHTPQDIVSCAKWIQGARRYFLQGFTDSGNLIGENLRAVPKPAMEAMASAAREFVPETQIRGV